MSSDITIVYYTANMIGDGVAKLIRDDLLNKVKGSRIISVSQKPLNFGDNICIGESGQSVWNLFRQVLIGAKEVKTKFMACAEDDYLYSKDHFSFYFYRDDTFYYDSNRWGLNQDGRFFWRPRTIFGMCLAPTKMMVETLEARFDKVKSPNSPYIKYFSEPGKYEGNYGIPEVRMERVYLDSPTITFNHRDSMGKRRMIRDTDIIKRDLPPWGDGQKLWKEYMG